MSAAYRYFTRVLLVLLLLGQNVCTHAQEYRFRHYTSANGLSQNSINDIYQDENGLLWIGTQDGLNLYDGKKFEHFRFTGTTGPIQDNFVITIADDGKGNLILGHRKGITVFSKKERKGYLLQPKAGVDYQPVTSIENVKGTTYFLSFDRELFVLEIQENGMYKAVPKEFGNQSVKPFGICNMNEEIMFLTHNGLLRNIQFQQGKDSTRFDFIPFPDGQQVSLSNSDYAQLSVGNGKYYIAANDKLFIYDSRKDPEKAITCIDSWVWGELDVSNKHFLDLEQDAKGNIWIASRDGIFIIQNDSTITHETLNREASEEGGKILVESLYKDEQGQMWVGTASIGLLAYNPEIERFRFLNQHHGLEDPTIWALEKQGRQLVLGSNSGLFVVTLDNPNLTDQTFLSRKVVSVKRSPFIPKTRVMGIKKVRDYYWVATKEAIYMLDDQLKALVQKFTHRDLGRSIAEVYNNIDVAVIDGRQVVLVGSFYGVLQFTPEGEYLGKIEAIGDIYLMDIFVDGNTLWLGTNDGLWKYGFTANTLKKYSFKESDSTGNSPSFKFISSIDRDDAGKDLWVGTFGGGINRFDPIAEKFERIGEEQGLANNVINGIAAVDSIIWVSHNKGISAYNSVTGEMYNYSQTEGVVFNEFAVNSVLKTDANELFFGSVEGINLINGDHFKMDEAPVQVPLISQVEINYGKSDASKVLNEETNQIRLKPAHKVMKLDLVIPDLAHEGNFIQYRLLGNDSTWRSVESYSNQITFSNLPYGEYTLQARLVNRHGQEAKTHLNIPMVIVAPVWRRWWFITLSAVVLAAIVVFISRYYSQRKLKEQLIRSEAEKRLLYEKQRISKDLHDNVGANITYLIHSLDNISFKLERDKELVPASELESLSNEARGTMDALRETIWAVNKDKVTLQDFKNRFDLYAGKMLSVADIKYKPRYQFDPLAKLSPFLAINVLRVMQEAVNNAVKHSQATLLELDFTYLDANNPNFNGSADTNQHGHLNVLIRDNGQGFDPNHEKTGHFGLQNMQDRIVELGGICTIQSAPGKGTTMTIEIG